MPQQWQHKNAQFKNLIATLNTLQLPGVDEMRCDAMHSDLIKSHLHV